MSTKERVRAFSHLPKNAVNFYKLKKGLYINNNCMRPKSLSRDHSVTNNSESRNIAKSVGLLTAYGELNANP